MELKTVLSDFSNDVCNMIYKNAKKLGVSGIGITGSYARGDYSTSRPDINFAVFADKHTPKLQLTIGSLLSDLNSKYSNHVNLHPEYHPERFTYPWGRDSNKTDLFFKIAIFQLKDKNSPMPFGRPGFVVEGHKLSMKLKHGKNHFEDIEITSDNRQVLKGVNYVLPQWNKKIKLTPLSYNLNKDVDLFFNESMIWGKLAIQQYAWVQGIKNGLDYTKNEHRKQIFENIHEKERLPDFIDVPENESGLIKLVLDGRNNYSEWRFSKEKAESIYAASSHLLDFFLNEAKKQQ
jgi:predicted nucleotidyltransferase